MSPNGSASSSARSTRASSTSGSTSPPRPRADSLEEAVAEIGLELSDRRSRPLRRSRRTSRAFKVMVRNAAFRRVELAARRDVAALAEAELPGGLDADGWSEALERYFSTPLEPRHRPATPAAQPGSTSPSDPGIWQVRQVLDDPEGWHDTAIVAEVDLAASDEAGVTCVADATPRAGPEASK